MRGDRPVVARRSRRLLQVAGILAVVVLAAVTLRGRLPDPAQLMRALGTAHFGWLALAVVAQLSALRHFGLQQRRLLAGFGVRMSIPRAVAVSYSRSALAFSLPAGSAVSAGFAFRQFRIVGASRRTAAAVTALSGVLTSAALLIMYLGVLVAERLGVTGDDARRSAATLVFTTIGVAIVVSTLDLYASHHPMPRSGARGAIDGPSRQDPDEDDAGSREGGPITRALRFLRGTVASLRELPPRSWGLSLLHAGVNWAADLACLAATAAAFGVDVSLTRIATVYLTVQVVRQIPLSPGGLGVVEVSLLAGLISAGAEEGPAAAAMVVYRLLSCWLIIPIGGLAITLLRRPGQRSPAASNPDPGPGPDPNPGADAASPPPATNGGAGYVQPSAARSRRRLSRMTDT